MTFPLQVLQELCLRPLCGELRATEAEFRIKERRRGRKNVPGHGSSQPSPGSCACLGWELWIWALGREGCAHKLLLA